MRFSSPLIWLTSAAAACVSASSLESSNPPTSKSLEELAKTLLNPKFCAIPNGSIDDACGATYDAVEFTNHRVRPIIANLVTTDFFRYYYLDLYGDNCPLGDDSGTCGNRACAVDTIEDEKDLPEIWRASYLGKLHKDTVATNVKNVEEDIELSCVDNADDSLASGGRLQKQAEAAWDKSCKDKNYCVPEDDRTGPNGVYVSLVDNPERYTGYNGPHAHLMWRSVYQQNCFDYKGESATSKVLRGESEEEDEVPVNASGNIDLTSDDTDTNKDQKMCIEQRLFYRVISGMHASVSTHLCYSYLDKTTGTWGPDLDCFMSRVGNYPERLSNLYFNYALVSRAIAKLNKYVDDLQFCPSSQAYDQATRRQILLLTKSVSKTSPHSIFNETLIFSSPEAKILKEEFRQRFHKVSALMDCVGCDRCRLWGKLQAAGYGTALKIVFELNEVEDEMSRKLIASLRRSELVSLVNTFDRLSKSIEAVEYFRGQIRQQIEASGVTVEEYIATKVNKRGQKNEEEPATTTSSEENTGKPTPPKKQTIWDDPEWQLWKEAFKFVLQSYIDFPKNIYKLFLINADYYWNALIGRDKAEAEDKFKRNQHIARVRHDDL